MSAEPGGDQAGRACFVCVADSRHFPGAVALVNSLRLVGHDEEIVFVDAGLDDAQRERIQPHVTLARPAEQSTRYFLKYAPVAPSRPVEVEIVVDADVIVTRSLDPLIASAAEGRFLGFADPVGDRFFPEWSESLDLPPLRRRPYVNAGFLVFQSAYGRRLFELVYERRGHISLEGTQHTRGRPAHAFFHYDQDVLNAVLASEPDERVVVLDHALAPHPPFRALRLVDVSTLRCRYADGREPYALHHVLEKPWLAHTRPNLYSLLLPRLLLGPDVTVRLDPTELPRRFRAGPLAALERRRSAVVAFGRAQRGRLGIRRWLEARLHGADPTPAPAVSDESQRGRAAER